MPDHDDDSASAGGSGHLPLQLEVPSLTSGPIHPDNGSAELSSQYVQMVDGYVGIASNSNSDNSDPALPPSPGIVSFDAAALNKYNSDATRALQSDVNDSKSVAESMLSSVLTADAISDPQGFAVVCLIVLAGDMGRGATFPTMWPLVNSLGGNSVTMGYAVAAFSFGRIIVSPIYGSLSVKHGYTIVLSVGVSIMLLGTLLYTQVVNVGRPEFLILAQTVMGVGSGTLGVTRAFIAEVSPTRNRTTYMAWLTAVQYAGFTVTPIIGAAFYSFFSHEGRGVEAGIFVLNAYTAPAYFMSFVCIVTLILMSIFFRGRNQMRNFPSRISRKRLEANDLANTPTRIGLTVFDACIVGCMLLNVATKGSIAVFETLGISFAESHFELNSSSAGTIVGTCGSLGVFALLFMGKLAKYFSDIQIIVGGMLVVVAGVLSLVGLEHEATNPSWRYLFSIVLIYSIGYPIGHTAVIGLFSKIVGRRPQGALLGFFASAGSAARMIFPIMSGYVSEDMDVQQVFIILAFVLLISIAFLLYAKDTLEYLIQ